MNSKFLLWQKLDVVSSLLLPSLVELAFIYLDAERMEEVNKLSKTIIECMEQKNILTKQIYETIISLEAKKGHVIPWSDYYNHKAGHNL